MPTSPPSVAPVPKWDRKGMEHIVYAPFAAPTSQRLNADGNLEYVRRLGVSWEKFSKYVVVRHGDNSRPLAVHPERVVYVVCHAHAKSNKVYDNEGKFLTVERLALQMKADGLTPKHKVVKLWACEGGVGGSQSTASQLLKQMRDLGFADLQIFGYTATITARDQTNGHSYVSGTNDRASTARIPARPPRR